ncbi:hypothetical protein CAPTEDRAFT_205482 [Capitella teleta]|uniref:Chitin-binding type-2 domain-containing protein n=1 Tax=Capitella teleta TaxID=283909 RepID=R7UH64_CAPTE|nr:hypothetical protein CAPTEDRAFT_205482 [Capitella teleta]|eukprot:ELU05428.1 hypothetical protein CAPTEDRAFT_205482 [Capitella teleta]
MELTSWILTACITISISNAFPSRQGYGVPGNVWAVNNPSPYQWTYQPQPMIPATAAPVTNAPITNAPVTNAPVTAAPNTPAPVTSSPSGPATVAPSGGHSYGQPWLVNPWVQPWAFPAGQPWSYGSNTPTVAPTPSPETPAPTSSPTVAPTAAPTDAPTVAPITQAPVTAQPGSGSGPKCEGIYPYGYRRSISVNSDAFETCDNGFWIRMNCAPGTWFQESTQQCTSNLGSGFGAVWNPSANAWQNGNGISAYWDNGAPSGVWPAPWSSDDAVTTTTAQVALPTTTVAPTTAVADDVITAMPANGQGSHYGHAAPWVQPWVNPWAGNPWSGVQPWYGGATGSPVSTDSPTGAPTNTPTDAPTDAPTVAPTEAPTAAPTGAATNAPIALPAVIYPPQPWSPGSGYSSWGSHHQQKPRKLTIQLQLDRKRK